MGKTKVVLFCLKREVLCLGVSKTKTQVCISELYKTLPPVRTKTEPIFHLAEFVN